MSRAPTSPEHDEHQEKLMSKIIQHYIVTADQETGEWLGEPSYIGTVTMAEWHAKQDTEDRHFDTYEHGGPLSGETRAIEVVWNRPD